MNQPVRIALIVVGVVLIIFGINASESIGSEFSEFFTGSPSEKSIWLIIGGLAALVVGGVGLARGAR